MWNRACSGFVRLAVLSMFVPTRGALGCGAGSGGATGPTALQGVFVPTGSMTAVRGVPLATLLRNGKVLIAGGWDGTKDLASADLYDSAAGTFTPTGSMTLAPDWPTATLLPSGKILIAGAQVDPNSGNLLPGAELYDPAAGKFAATGDMTVAREIHTATLLPGGTVLIAGGESYPGGALTYLASAELYDPSSGTFTPTGSMTAARSAHTATSLPNGMVLLAGGWNRNALGTTMLASAEIYDPATGTFTATDSMAVTRQWFTATLLRNGMVLITGGQSGNALGTTSLASAELYDPAAGTFAPIGSMTVPRYSHTATLLASGLVLIAGGRDDNGDTVASADLYDPAAGTFAPTGSMTVPRDEHTATLLPSGKVLIAGGYDSVAQENVASAELYE